MSSTFDETAEMETYFTKQSKFVHYKGRHEKRVATRRLTTMSIMHAANEHKRPNHAANGILVAVVVRNSWAKYST